MNTNTAIAPQLICRPPEVRRSVLAGSDAGTPAADATGFHTGMHTAGIERALAKRQLLPLPDADAKLVCLEGELWLTRDGDIEDYILRAGQSMMIRRGDQATVQALRPSRLRLVGA